MIYIPADVRKDSAFPFRPGDDVLVTIKNGKLIVERFRGRE